MGMGFQTAMNVGNKLGQKFEQRQDENAIESILSQAMSSGSPEVLQNSIGQILSKVSPQNQGKAIEFLQGSMQQIQHRQQQEQGRAAAKEAGYTYGAPPQVQARQVQDNAKQGRLAQYGLGNSQNIPGQPQVQSPGAQPPSINGQPTQQPGPQASQIQSPLLKLSDDELKILTGHPDREVSEPAKQILKSRQEETKANKSHFEPESDKLEAKRVSELSTEIENEYKSAKNEDLRLERMGVLDEKGNVSAPLLLKAMDFIGIPIGVLNNPDTEEFRKLEADFVRDVSKVFPGGKITNYELGSYLKTIPGLLNSPDGRKAIIRNRKLLNDAKTVRYQAYKDILRENNGRRPPNLGLLVDDKIAEKMNAIEDRFIAGISKESEKFQQSVRMFDPEGNALDVPPNQIERALQAGAKFR